MRWFWVALLTPVATLAQTTPLVSGVLLERDAPGPGGELSLRAPDDQVFRFRFDAQTKVERDGAASEIARIEPGDRVELVPDRMPHADLRYAVSIQSTAGPPRPIAYMRPGREAPPAHALFAADALSYAGVVSQLTPARVVLHMRNGADQPIVLLKETRYMNDGANVDAAALQMNMHVFVRAGKSLYGDVEAYQVMWGQILQPR
ncbi:MAG TPA: hypothetical protein VMU19_14805 [Bryobacteraceae bacterium]|nr:hypothetical protein [Bryobacteraceae bacterium]